MMNDEELELRSLVENAKEIGLDLDDDIVNWIIVGSNFSQEKKTAKIQTLIGKAAELKEAKKGDAAAREHSIEAMYGSTFTCFKLPPVKLNRAAPPSTHAKEKEVDTQVEKVTFVQEALIERLTEGNWVKLEDIRIPTEREGKLLISGIGPTVFNTNKGGLEYANEADIQYYCLALVNDVLKCLGLFTTEVIAHLEVSIYTMRPDIIIVLRRSGKIFFAIEVKTPELHDSEVFGSRSVAGQIVSYLLAMKALGNPCPMGAIMTYNKIVLVTLKDFFATSDENEDGNDGLEGMETESGGNEGEARKEESKLNGMKPRDDDDDDDNGIDSQKNEENGIEKYKESVAVASKLLKEDNFPPLTVIADEAEACESRTRTPKKKPVPVVIMTKNKTEFDEELRKSFPKKKKKKIEPSVEDEDLDHVVKLQAFMSPVHVEGQVFPFLLQAILVAYLTGKVAKQNVVSVSENDGLGGESAFKISEDSFSWVTIRKGVTARIGDSNYARSRRFYVLGPLGDGRTAAVYLAATISGSICALKSYYVKSGSKADFDIVMKDAQEGEERWNELYKDRFKVCSLKLGNNPCLLMPYGTDVIPQKDGVSSSDNDVWSHRWNHIREILEELRRIAQAGYQYERSDLRFAHILLGADKKIFFCDLESLERIKDENPDIDSIAWSQLRTLFNPMMCDASNIPACRDWLRQNKRNPSELFERCKQCLQPILSDDLLDELTDESVNSDKHQVLLSALWFWNQHIKDAKVEKGQEKTGDSPLSKNSLESSTSNGATISTANSRKENDDNIISQQKGPKRPPIANTSSAMPLSSETTGNKHGRQD